MQPFEATGFAEFDRMAALFRRTFAVLDELTARREPPEAMEEVAADALAHVDDIEQGFHLWLRAGSAELTELRAFVARAGIEIAAPRGPAEERAALVEAMHELALAARSEILPAPGRALAALQHARLVFALLPLTPADEVHFPAGRRTYADIFAPRRPAELAERIDELARSLWAVATRQRPSLSDPRYRRTFGFFDTAARISGGQFHAA